jgi:hypothetical protein
VKHKVFWVEPCGDETTPGETFGGLSIDKDVSGDAPAADTSFAFDVDCSNGLDTTVDLTAGAAAAVIADLPTGTTCTVVETEDHGATGTSWTGGTAIAGENGVSITIGDGTTVAVTATNAFEAPDVVTPPAATPPVATPVEAPPAVLPEVVTPPRPMAPTGQVKPAKVKPSRVLGTSESRPQQLARTGSTTLPLVELGLGLVLLGVGSVLFARERPVTR